ncbi:MAG TPA: M56 family metallopeptidase [Solirubrobacteraceae bacterium]|jgi:Zn-dependent protease with chaperone function|nr:M56 family metallopeptidase [Solirubrobacteraceae bacterium]
MEPRAADASLVPQAPAATAAGRLFGASVLLGVLGLASAVFVITRLFESWRVTSGAASHVVSVFGQRLSYPAANTGAVVVTALAGLGLLMVGAAAWGLARELLAERSFRRALQARSPTALHGARGASVFNDKRPQAFCAGLLRPLVYLSTGALELLDGPALEAVLAHERHHASRHDPLRLACGRVLAAGLFFIPSLGRLVERQHTLAEISADETALRTSGGDPSALASAMLSFSQAGGADALGVDPERVDHLLGERTQWRFPVALFLATAAILSLLITVAILAAHLAAGSATLAPPFLSSQPCIAVMAMIPVATGLTGLAYVRARRAPRAVAPAKK